jgi:hypothetical protein
MDERNTRATVSLPPSDPVHFFAGHGHGAFCNECGGAITRNDLEYQIEWAEPVRTLRMHARCYEIWHAERSEGPVPRAS